MTGYHFRQLKRVIEIAQSILDGDTGIIAGSRLLASLRFEIGLANPDFDEDFIVFMVIDSETDHLPIGKYREGWAADALARKDAEVTAIEERARGDALAGCLRLIERFRANLTAHLNEQACNID